MTPVPLMTRPPRLSRLSRWLRRIVARILPSAAATTAQPRPWSDQYAGNI